MNERLKRYHRQILLPGIGEEGQEKLLQSTVLLVGCGALGTVIANGLVRAGVGHVVICDRDFVELTNLQRQILFDESDVRDLVPKAEAAKRKLYAINSEVQVTAVVDDVNYKNIERLAVGSVWGKVDVILDGVDNFETRYLVNDVAVKHGIPFVYGGAVGTVGLSFAILPHTIGGQALWEEQGKATPCIRCIFEKAPPAGLNPTCDTAGVLGPVVSLIANFQVNETLKILTGNWQAVNSQMLRVDTWENEYRQLKVTRCYEVGDCVCCKQRNFEFLSGRFSSATTTLCGQNAVQITQKLSEGRKVEFSEIAERLRAHGGVQLSSFMLRAEVTEHGNPYELTLFTDGRAIVKGTKSPDVAKGIYAKYIGV